MKVWVTKYALSGGITEHECEKPKDGSSTVYPGAPFADFVGFKLGRDAFTDRGEAAKAADLARQKRIASLKKQLADLEKLRF